MKSYWNCPYSIHHGNHIRSYKQNILNQIKTMHIILWSECHYNIFLSVDFVDIYRTTKVVIVWFMVNMSMYLTRNWFELIKLYYLKKRRY